MKLQSLLFAALVVSHLPHAFSEPLSIRITNGEWEPYLSQWSYQYGYASQVVREAFALRGIDVEFGFFPWRRAYLEAAEGETWQASAVWWANGETQEQFWISDKVIDTSYVLFHLKAFEFDWQDFDDLEPYSLGITLGYDYGETLNWKIETGMVKSETVWNDELNFGKLLAGRIDLFANDPVVGWAQIRNNFSNEQQALFTHHPRQFNQTSLHLIISKNTEYGEYFRDEFNLGLQTLKESGRLQELETLLLSGRYDQSSHDLLDD